jgi:predicted hydrocarbon binding protein
MPNIRGPLRQLEETIRSDAGEEAAAGIMVGSESLKDSSSKEKVAKWVKGAMELMDEALDPQVSERIMAACGRNCADHHGSVVERAKARRAKYSTLEELLDAEEKKPQKGSLLEREGPDIIVGYTPESYGVRCYCSLVQGLPAGEAMSRTYCGCSKGFVERYWEQVLGRPVEAELLESAVTGSKVCRFRVGSA